MLRLEMPSDASLDRRETKPMFPIRMTSPIPAPPIGRDLSATGICEDGQFYFCKADDGHRRVRATEQLFTSLANHLSIATAPTQAVELNGEVLFGSRRHPSTESMEAVRAFYLTKGVNEFGAPSTWKGGYFSRLYVFDVFAGNGDRSGNNLVGYRDGATVHVAAIDFADATLLMRPDAGIDLAGTRTQAFWRMMRGLHGFDQDAAFEMAAGLENVPVSYIEGVLNRLSPGWLDDRQTQKFLEFWSGDSRSERLARLRGGLRDGSLL